STLITRNNLAAWRGEAGDPVGAAAAFAHLLNDQLRVLGPDHPSTLTIRNNLTYWRGRAGHAASTASVSGFVAPDGLAVPYSVAVSGDERITADEGQCDSAD
ncbi:tetratricopeptide repeat protein, partial [Frankia sp. Mgl5]